MDLLKEKYLHKAKQNYLENGFCVIKNFVGLDSRNLLFQELEKIIAELKINGNIGSHINFADKENKIVNSIHRLEEIDNKIVSNFIIENKFTELADNLTGEPCALFSIQAFLKPPGKGLKTPAHQDNAYWCHTSEGGLTFWLSLDKAGKFNGMMKYGYGSNKTLIDHEVSSNTPGSSLVISETKLSDFKWYQPELNPGDLSVHDGLVVHYSDKNTSNSPRRGFLLNYRPISYKRDQIKYQKYLNQLEKIHNR